MDITEKQLDKALESTMDGSDPVSFQNPGSFDVTVESLMERFGPLQSQILPVSVREKLAKAEGYAQEFANGAMSKERAIMAISQVVNDPEIVEAVSLAIAH